MSRKINRDEFIERMARNICAKQGVDPDSRQRRRPVSAAELTDAEGFVHAPAFEVFVPEAGRYFDCAIAFRETLEELAKESTSNGAGT